MDIQTKIRVNYKTEYSTVLKKMDDGLINQFTQTDTDIQKKKKKTIKHGFLPKHLIFTCPQCIHVPLQKYWHIKASPYVLATVVLRCLVVEIITLPYILTSVHI